MPTKPKQRFTHTCLRCNYIWIGKKNPTTCANPRCNTTYWNKKYVLAVNRKKNKYRFSKNEKDKANLKKRLTNKKRIQHTCLRCSYMWIGKKNPMSCPNQKCRSIVWDKPK